MSELAKVFFILFELLLLVGLSDVEKFLNVY
jgi:hypothetical protein